MPDKTWDELAAERLELTEQLNDLQQQLTPLEEVTQANATVDELRAMLRSTAEGTEGAKEELEDYVGKLRDLGGEIEDYLDDPSVQELTEGVGEGLGEFQEALGAVDEEVERLDEVLDQIQKYMEYEDAPADQQIEALAEAFEQAVDKLGPLIKRIPGLGTFFEIYALAIKRIAESVSSIQATQRQLQKAWGQIRPGTTMYLVPRNAHERQQAAIREVELKLENNFNSMMGVAQDSREQIPENKANEVDVAVRAAESRCSDLQPQTNAPELKARNAAWKAVEDAEGKRNRAADELERSSAEADRDAARLAATRGAGREGSADMAALQARAEASERSRDRAQARLAERETEFDSAMSRFETAKAPWDSIRQAYIDCVKSHISALGIHANRGQGFNVSDLEYLRIMYPEYDLNAEVPAAPPADTTKETAGLSGRQKLVIMGGGGILALASLGIVFVVGGWNDNSIGLEVQQESEVVVTTTTQVTTTEGPTTTASSSTTTTLPLATSAIDYVTITDTNVIADPSSDVWVELTFAGSWIEGPPPLDTAWFMRTSVGIITGGQFHGTSWSLQDGKTRGEAFMDGDVKAALNGEMWVTPEGRLVVRLPGLSDTDGLSASNLAADAQISLYAQVVPEEGADFERVERIVSLGEVTQSRDVLPLSDWILVETDFGPITLVIPAGD